MIGKVLLGSLVLITAVTSTSFVGYGILSGDIYSGGHHHNHGSFREYGINDHCNEGENEICSPGEANGYIHECDDFCDVKETEDCIEYNEDCLEEYGACNRK